MPEIKQRHFCPMNVLLLRSPRLKQNVVVGSNLVLSRASPQSFVSLTVECTPVASRFTPAGA
jgi:hypothetical protein